MADFAVSTAFRAKKDGITKSFRDQDKAAARFGRTASRAFRDSSKSASRFRDVTKGILTAGAVTRVLSGLTAGLRSVTTQFIDFDQATIGAASRFKDIGPDAANFEEQLGKIRDRAREAGASTEFTAAQSASALDFLARAGFESALAFGALDSMINLATASGEDFATVADFSSDLMGAFGLNVGNAAQKIKNLNRLNDVLVKSANSANVTIESMFETMKTAGPISRITGTSLEEVASLTAALGNAGIKGTEGATALKNAMLRLAAPTGEVQQALDFLNITADDGTGNMKKITAILGEVRDGLEGVGEVKQAKVLNALFGKRAIAGAKNLIESLEGIDKFEKILNNAGGTAEKTAARMRQSLGNRLKALGSAASELGFKIIEAFEVRGEGAIDKFTEAIRGFDPGPIIRGVEGIITVMSALWSVIGPILSGMKQFVEFTAEIAAVAFDSVIDLISVIESIAVKAAVIFDKIPEILKSLDIGFGNVLNPLLSGIASAFEFIGVPKPPEKEQQRTAPNQAEADARQGIDFKGQININGAPAGSTAESETRGAPGIDMVLLGAG